MNTACLKVTAAGMKLSGCITFLNLPHLKNEGIRLLKSLAHCEVDCSELIQINSAALALFLAWLRYAKKKGKTLLFSKAHPALKTLVGLYSLDTILTFQDEGGHFCG